VATPHRCKREPSSTAVLAQLVPDVGVSDRQRPGRTAACRSLCLLDAIISGADTAMTHGLHTVDLSAVRCTGNRPGVLVEKGWRRDRRGGPHLRTARSGSPDALLHRGPLRSVRATRRGIRLKQAPEGVSGVEDCWFFVGAGCPALAVRVNEAGAVRCGPIPEGGHVVLGDRFAGDPMPLFPFGRGGWLVVGVQEKVLA
jgi:hypothetical protein